MQLSSLFVHNRLMRLLNTYREHFRGFKSDMPRKAFFELIGTARTKLENGGVKLKDNLTFL